MAVVTRPLLTFVRTMVTVILFLVVLPYVASADEDDWQLSARAGVASVAVDGRDPLGVRVGLDGQYGLSDAWGLRLTGTFSRLDISEDKMAALPGGAIWSYSAMASIVYAMDVLRLLPTFEVGLAMLGLNGAVKTPHRAIGMQAALGADYLLGPRLSIGGIAEYIFAPFDLVSNALTGNAVPQAFAFSVRGSWTFH
jgi:Outer membrane protein beta-barrel domain